MSARTLKLEILRTLRLIWEKRKENIDCIITFDEAFTEIVTWYPKVKQGVFFATLLYVLNQTEDIVLVGDSCINISDLKPIEIKVQ